MIIKSIQFKYKKTDDAGKETNSPLFLSVRPSVPIAHGENSLSERQYAAIRRNPVFIQLLKSGAIVSENEFKVIEIDQPRKGEAKSSQKKGIKTDDANSKGKV